MRWKCGVSYDGTGYAGWQVQEGERSIQKVIEDCLSEILKQETKIVGSGRTDAGVHAAEQVFHFDYDWKHEPESLVEALRSLLPESITPRYAERADDSFHARFSAISKCYRYRVYLGKAPAIESRYCWSLYGSLDFESMAKAMKLLEGKHDFAAFAANRGVEYESTVRSLYRTEMMLDDRYLYLEFQADGFLYKMVRSFVGAVANVGLGRLSLEAFSNLIQAAERTPMVFVAPANGLFLKKVYY